MGKRTDEDKIRLGSNNCPHALFNYNRQRQKSISSYLHVKYFFLRRYQIFPFFEVNCYLEVVNFCSEESHSFDDLLSYYLSFTR